MKKIIFTLIFILTFFIANDSAFALKKPQFTNIAINTVNNTLSGELNNAHVGGEIEFSLYSLEHGPYSAYQNIYLGDYIEWKEGAFSINIGSALISVTADTNENSFSDNTYNPVFTYDAILMDVGDDDSVVENRDHVGFSIVSSGSTVTQNTSSSNVNVTIESAYPTSILIEKGTNSNSNDYFKISYKFSRSESADVYLVLSRTPKTGGTSTLFDLCRRPAGVDGGGNGDYLLTFDPDPTTPNCVEQLAISANMFTFDYNYRTYLSNVSKGLPISSEYLLEGITEPQQAIIVSNIIATAKKQGAKNYYEITGTISETKPGKSINFVVTKNGETSGKIIGEASYTQGNFSIPSISEIQAIENLDPGQYTLRISEIGGGQLQADTLLSIAIPDATGSTTAVVTIDPFEYTEAQNNIINKGLVTKDCGYKLGKGEGGRICGFADFITLIGRIIEYIFILVLPIAAIVFAYAGFLFMTSGEDASKRTAAKTAMTKLVIGIVVIMAAWLIVKTVLKTLGVDAGFTMFLDLR